MKNLNAIESKTSNNIPKVPKPILLTGKFLQSFSSTLTTNFAVRLFKTPIRYKTPEREKIMGKSAQSKLVFIPELNIEVMVYTYGYSTKKVLLVHGWSGRGTQLYAIADRLLENRFMTISFDAPAHGKSKGTTTMMTEFITISKYLEKEMGPFEFAVGHSLGGMAVLNSIKQQLNIKKAVVIGAGDIITDIITFFVEKLELKLKYVEKIKLHFYKKYNQHIDDYSGSEAAKDIKIPVLVIHDSSDKEVPVSCAYNIRQNLEQGELLITNSLGHKRILKDNQVIGRVVEFIKRNE